MHDNVNKYFTTKNIVFFVMAILFLLFLGKIADIALICFAAFVISAALAPPIDKMSKYMPRVLAVCIVLLVTLFFTLAVFVPLGIFTVKQGILFLQNLPDILENFKQPLSFSIMGFSLDSVLNKINLHNIGADVLSDFANDVVSKSISVTKMVMNAFTAIIAVTIMVFYISYDKNVMKKGFTALFPAKFKEKADLILETITTRVGGYLMAQIITMLFVGVVTALGLILLGNKHAVLLGFITCMFDIIPVIGPTIAVVIGLFVAAPQGFLIVILTFAVYMIAQILQNQLLRPIVFGKFMDMHPLTIILALLIGAKFLNFWGVILGPAIASVVCVLVDELYIKPINQESDIIEIGKEEKQ